MANSVTLTGGRDSGSADGSRIRGRNTCLAPGVGNPRYATDVTIKPSGGNCLRNHHATMMGITTWAREYFGKSLSLNTVAFASRNATSNCNMQNFAQKRQRVLWTRRDLIWTERQWKRVLWSDESTFQLVFWKNGHRILRAKD